MSFQQQNNNIINNLEQDHDDPNEVLMNESWDMRSSSSDSSSSDDDYDDTQSYSSKNQKFWGRRKKKHSNTQQPDVEVVATSSDRHKVIETTTATTTTPPPREAARSKSSTSSENDGSAGAQRILRAPSSLSGSRLMSSNRYNNKSPLANSSSSSSGRTASRSELLLRQTSSKIPRQPVSTPSLSLNHRPSCLRKRSSWYADHSEFMSFYEPTKDDDENDGLNEEEEEEEEGKYPEMEDEEKKEDDEPIAAAAAQQHRRPTPPRRQPSRSLRLHAELGSAEAYSSSPESNDPQSSQQQPTRHETDKEYDESYEPPPFFHHKLWTLLPDESQLNMLYLAAFSTLGMILRVYTGRLMGLDCNHRYEEHNHTTTEHTTIHDVWEPIFSSICITHNGWFDESTRTKSVAGAAALFTDLPANMLGCLVMGLLLPQFALQEIPHHAIPWLSRHHRLQGFLGFHMALTTGFCGCLTTFAAWNTQMVAMMDGTGTGVGSQVAPALFGYLIGIYCPVTSFLVGRHARHSWIKYSNRRRTASNTNDSKSHQSERNEDRKPLRNGDIEANRNRMDGGQSPDLPPNLDSPPSPNEATQSTQSGSPISRQGAKGIVRSGQNGTSTRIRLFLASCHDKVLVPFLTFVFGVDFGPFLWVLVFVTVFAVADAVYEIPFYRTMWMNCLLSPLGAMLRWKLSLFNIPSRSVASVRPLSSLDEKRGTPSSAWPAMIQWVANCWRHRPDWVPWGTLMANCLGVVIAALAEAMDTKYLSRNDGMMGYAWWSTFVPALKQGFAGSLTTVSTLVKELFAMQQQETRPGHAYLYCIGSLVISMFLGLAIYSPIVRS